MLEAPGKNSSEFILTRPNLNSVFLFFTLFLCYFEQTQSRKPKLLLSLNSRITYYTYFASDLMQFLPQIMGHEVFYHHLLLESQ